MKQVSHRGYLLVEVPLSAQGISFSKFAHVPKERLEWWIDTFTGSEYDCIDLPPGSYEIIGKGNEIKEGVWDRIVTTCLGGIMNDDILGYKNYILNDKYFETATESGHSLIKSHGMKPEQCLILKLINTNT